MVQPERQIPLPHRAWWSDTIKHAHLIVQSWKIKVSLQQQPQHDESIIDSILNKLGPDVDVYQDTPNALPTSQLCCAIKYCKKCWDKSFQLQQEFLEWLAEDMIDGYTKKDKNK
eukprot:7546118-Ditylum_brightwellii.AAC.1